MTDSTRPTRILSFNPIKIMFGSPTCVGLGILGQVEVDVWQSNERSKRQHKTIHHTHALCDLRALDRLLIGSVMSFSIAFCGGTLLITMGQQTRSESLFYCFTLEDVPEGHLVRNYQ